MKHNTAQLVLTPRELFYLLFKEKKCPNCKGELIGRKGYETINEESSFINKSATSFHFSYRWPPRKIKNYIFYFVCEECDSSFRLSELAEKRKKCENE